MQQTLKSALKDKYIICSCEGTAEKTIIDLLLDGGFLCFTREDLVGQEVTTLRKGYEIEKEYFHVAYEKELVLLRILDRPREIIRFHKQYVDRCTVCNICTKPEIESFIIISEGKWKDFKKRRKMKPSDYCKGELKLKDIKKEDYIKEYYADANKLQAVIVEYNRITKHVKGVYNFCDLLKL